MGMTPDEFLDTFVDGNLSDYQKEPGDIRRAFNAALSAAHAADNIFNYGRRHNAVLVEGFGGIGEFVDYLSNLSDGAFLDIWSIANAHKHLYTSRVKATVGSGGALYSVTFEDDPNMATVELDRPGAGSANGHSCVMFTRKDGTRIAFLPVLERAVQCLRQAVYDCA